MILGGFATGFVILYTKGFTKIDRFGSEEVNKNLDFARRYVAIRDMAITSNELDAAEEALSQFHKDCVEHIENNEKEKAERKSSFKLISFDRH